MIESRATAMYVGAYTEETRHVNLETSLDEFYRSRDMHTSHTIDN